jgi:hypothetical protein
MEDEMICLAHELKTANRQVLAYAGVAKAFGAFIGDSAIILNRVSRI